MRSYCLILIIFIISGCSAGNLLYDQNKAFERQRNSEIGKSLNKVLRAEAYYDFLEGNKHTHWYKETIIKKIDDINSEYHYYWGDCKWALIVNTKTRIVTSWKFTGEPKECKHKYLYEGPF